MITHTDGHWRSHVTKADDQNILSDLLDDKSLTPEEKLAVQAILKDYQDTSSPNIIDELSHDQWDEIPIPIEEWLNSNHHIGDIGDSLYPKVREDVISLFNGDYSEAILTGSIGWGKTMMATTCIVRILYEILCLKSPQKSLGIAPSEPIYIVPVSSRKDLANKVAFGGIAGKLMVIDWFKGKFVQTKDEIRCPDKRIFITGGSSNDAGVLGLNVICCLVDESNFFGNKKSGTTGVGSREIEDKAQIIYNALARRVKSRFQRAGVKGMIFLVSSKRSTSDFTERRIIQARDNNDNGVFVRDYASWEVTPAYYVNQKWHRMLVAPDTGRSRILEEDEPNPEGSFVIDFPDDFLGEALMDADGFIRDIAGVALENVLPFIAKRKAIDDAMKPDWPHPFSVYEWDTEGPMEIKWDLITDMDVFDEAAPICCPGAPRHVALDMSKKWDATGFCCAHIGGVKQVVRKDDETRKEYIEEVPIVHVDGLLRVTAPVSGEIDHQKVRHIVYRLQRGGIPIRSVSMDQWCAPPNLQQFRKKGLKTFEISVDKKFDPYLILRNSLYEDRIVMGKYDILRKELRELEISANGRKIDHPARGSKDLSDCLAAAVFYLSTIAKPGGPAVAPSKGFSLKATGNAKAFPTASGGFIWPDEVQEKGDSQGGNIPSWIVL